MRRPLASGLVLKAKAKCLLSRPISVKGVGDKDADAKNYKKRFKHGQPSRNKYRSLTQCPSRKPAAVAQSK